VTGVHYSILHGADPTSSMCNSCVDTGTQQMECRVLYCFVTVAGGSFHASQNCCVVVDNVAICNVHIPLEGFSPHYSEVTSCSTYRIHRTLEPQMNTRRGNVTVPG
jgi:hypothetical protein